MNADAHGHEDFLVAPQADPEPSEDQVVAELVERIGDLEWQLDLDDVDPEGIDIAIDAAAELALIYSHLGDMPVRDHMLDRLNQLVSDHRTRKRMNVAAKVYAQIAGHPVRVSAA